LLVVPAFPAFLALLVVLLVAVPRVGARMACLASLVLVSAGEAVCIVHSLVHSLLVVDVPVETARDSFLLRVRHWSETLEILNFFLRKGILVSINFLNKNF
jgi:hypothetical protein